MDGMELIAHKNEGASQSLVEHLKNVAQKASSFAESFNNADWAYCAGLLHDLGKADEEWQKYIHGEKSSTGVNHSEAGAQYVHSLLNPQDPFSKVIPYYIAGHHAAPSRGQYDFSIV